MGTGAVKRATMTLMLDGDMDLDDGWFMYGYWMGLNGTDLKYPVALPNAAESMYAYSGYREGLWVRSQLK